MNSQITSLLLRVGYRGELALRRRMGPVFHSSTSPCQELVVLRPVHVLHLPHIRLGGRERRRRHGQRGKQGQRRLTLSRQQRRQGRVHCSLSCFVYCSGRRSLPETSSTPYPRKTLQGPKFHGHGAGVIITHPSLQKLVHTHNTLPQKVRRVGEALRPRLLRPNTSGVVAESPYLDVREFLVKSRVPAGTGITESISTVSGKTRTDSTTSRVHRV